MFFVLVWPAPPSRTPTAQIHTHGSACYCLFTDQEDGSETQLHLIITWQAEGVYYLFWIILVAERHYYVCVWREGGSAAAAEETTFQEY